LRGLTSGLEQAFGAGLEAGATLDDDIRCNPTQAVGEPAALPELKKQARAREG
jgi:hypothetical protein